MYVLSITSVKTDVASFYLWLAGRSSDKSFIWRNKRVWHTAGSFDMARKKADVSQLIG